MCQTGSKAVFTMCKKQPFRSGVASLSAPKVVGWLVVVYRGEQGHFSLIQMMPAPCSGILCSLDRDDDDDDNDCNDDWGVEDDDDNGDNFTPSAGGFLLLKFFRVPTFRSSIFCPLVNDEFFCVCK